MSMRSTVVVGILLGLFVVVWFFPVNLWLEETLRQEYGVVKPDPSLLCRKLLDEPFEKLSVEELLRTDTAQLTKRAAILEICKNQEEIKELNRRYRERQTLLGRLGSISGLIFAFITAVATLSVAYLGSRWATSRTAAEQRVIEQKRKIDRNEYDFKLFTALSSNEGELSRIAASSALQARLSEIEDDRKKVQKGFFLIGANKDTLSNLDVETQTIIRVFLSALKESKAKQINPSSSAQPEENEFGLVANKSIAEGFAEALKCFADHGATPKPPSIYKPSNPAFYEKDSIGASPLIRYDVQKLDLRSVYWGAQDKKPGLKGRGGFIGRGLDFFESDFTSASLRGAFLEKAVFYNTRLVKTKFQSARLQSANFEKATIEDCDFRGADVSGCDFSKCKSFENNNFKTAIVDNNTIWPPGHSPNPTTG